MCVGNWLINVSYGVTKKRKNWNIEDKPLMLFVTVRMKILIFFYIFAVTP